MGQILAIDYGKARCGIAATDDMQIIASGLETVENRSLMEFLKKYFSENNRTAAVRAFPAEGLDIPIWILGSSTEANISNCRKPTRGGPCRPTSARRQSSPHSPVKSKTDA